MGSFFGHIDEAIFFIVLGSWWMYNSYPTYIKALWHGEEYRTKLSYSLSGTKKIPIEAICKLIFTLCGFLAEFFIDGGPKFFDEDKNFIHMNRIQHMSIFGLFVLHSSIDLLMRLGAPLPRGLDRITAALAFSWYGICFDFHTRMHEKGGVERMIHILPTYVMHMISVAYILEMIRPSWFMAHLIRIYGILVLGTWTVFTAYVLFLPKPFPGSKQNPNWDRGDMKNVHFMVAAFGYNLGLHLAIMTCTYLFTLCVMRARGQHRPEFTQMTSLYKCKSEGNSFLRSL